MERVVDILGEVAENGDSEVKYLVLELGVLDEKVNVEDLDLQFCEVVAVVWFVTEVEFGSLRTLEHKNHVRHFDGHFIDGVPFVVFEEPHVGLSFVVIDKLTPFLLCYQVLFVYCIKYDEEATACALDVAEVADCVGDPFLNFQVDVMVLLLGEAKENGVDAKADDCREVFESHEAIWGDFNGGTR